MNPEYNLEVDKDAKTDIMVISVRGDLIKELRKMFTTTSVNSLISKAIFEYIKNYQKGDNQMADKNCEMDYLGYVFIRDNFEDLYLLVENEIVSKKNTAKIIEKILRQKHGSRSDIVNMLIHCAYYIENKRNELMQELGD